jgi:hypothetical protein
MQNKNDLDSIGKYLANRMDNTSYWNVYRIKDSNQMYLGNKPDDPSDELVIEKACPNTAVTVYFIGPTDLDGKKKWEGPYYDYFTAQLHLSAQEEIPTDEFSQPTQLRWVRFSPGAKSNSTIYALTTLKPVPLVRSVNSEMDWRWNADPNMADYSYPE